MTHGEPLRIEDLKVGDTVPADAMLKGPFSVPMWPADGPCEWLTINSDLPVAAFIGPDANE